MYDFLIQYKKGIHFRECKNMKHASARLRRKIKQKMIRSLYTLVAQEAKDAKRQKTKFQKRTK